MLVWLSVWSKVQIVCIWSTWYHCHLKTSSSLALFQSRLILLFWYQLTQVVLEKRPLNGCSSSSCCCCKSQLQSVVVVLVLFVTFCQSSSNYYAFETSLKMCIVTWTGVNRIRNVWSWCWLHLTSTTGWWQKHKTATVLSLHAVALF